MTEMIRYPNYIAKVTFQFTRHSGQDVAGIQAALARKDKKFSDDSRII